MTTLSAKSVPRSLMSSLVAVEPDTRATHSATHITGGRRLVRLSSAAASHLSAYRSNHRHIALAPQVTVPCHSLPIRVGDVKFLENCLEMIFKPLALSSLQTGTLSHFAAHHLTWKPTLRHPAHVTSLSQLALCQDAFQGVIPALWRISRCGTLCHHFIPIIRCRQRMWNDSNALIWRL